MRKLLAVMALAMTACMPPATFAPITLRTPFNEAEYANYKASGTAKISGQSFAKTRGGDVKYCAGNPVVLVPETEYTKQWAVLKFEYFPTYKVDPMDTRIAPYTRTVTSDAEGKFTFTEVPPGSYIIQCDVTWEVPGSAYSMETTGGAAMARVTVTAGQELTNVIVTR